MIRLNRDEAQTRYFYCLRRLRRGPHSSWRSPRSLRQSLNLTSASTLAWRFARRARFAHSNNFASRSAIFLGCCCMLILPTAQNIYMRVQQPIQSLIICRGVSNVIHLSCATFSLGELLLFRLMPGHIWLLCYRGRCTACGGDRATRRSGWRRSSPLLRTN